MFVTGNRRISLKASIFVLSCAMQKEIYAYNGFKILHSSSELGSFDAHMLDFTDELTLEFIDQCEDKNHYNYQYYNGDDVEYDGEYNGDDVEYDGEYDGENYSEYDGEEYEYDDEYDSAYEDHEYDDEHDSEYDHEYDSAYDDESWLTSIKTSHDYEAIPRDDGFDWKVNGTTADFWFKLGCSEIFENDRPVHLQSTWEHARAYYKSIVSDYNSNDLSNLSQNGGFSVDFEAKISPGKGRGIFAAQDIEAGTLVYQAKQTARFENGEDYREFLLGLERGFACDVLQWAYIQTLNDSPNQEDAWISVDLDEGSFCNDGGQGKSVGCDEDLGETVEGGCKLNYFALRDIEAGEELFCDYSSFISKFSSWDDFGLY